MYLSEKNPAHPDVLTPPRLFAAVKQEVDRLYKSELSNYGIDAAGVICDITGGLSVMTAGMALACAEEGRDMQFVLAVYDDTGPVGRGKVVFVKRGKPRGSWLG